MLRSLFSMLSPAGASARLQILIFHRVLPQADPLFPEEIDAPRFDQLCGWLSEWFRVLPLDVAVRQLREGHLPARALSITFDDGYADNYDVALPILQRHGLTATFFIATGFLDGGRMWNDTVVESIRRTTKPGLDLRDLGLADVGQLELGSSAQRRVAIDAVIGAVKYQAPPHRAALVGRVATHAQAELPGDLMMQSAQVRGLHRAGMQIGCHTVSHPILARLPSAEARHEIEESRRQLGSIIGDRISLFAYPNGKPVEDYTAESVAIVRELGFDAAVSTAWGASRRTSDLFQLPRFTPWDTSKLRFGARLMRNLWVS